LRGLFSIEANSTYRNCVVEVNFDPVSPAEIVVKRAVQFLVETMFSCNPEGNTAFVAVPAKL
jgi:hypothetical protein